MKSIFVDTTNLLTIGILDDNQNWLSFKTIETSKTSSVLHKVIEDQLLESSTKKTDINGFIYMAGPGSYTGMRVAEGIANIFEWQGLKIYNLYHFDVPRLLGEEKYCWKANAYKNETFLYEYEMGKESKSLVASSSKLDAYEYENTISMIEKSPSIIFGKVIDNEIKKELFYYRNIEEEFQKAK